MYFAVYQLKKRINIFVLLGVRQKRLISFFLTETGKKDGRKQ